MPIKEATLLACILRMNIFIKKFQKVKQNILREEK
jgi:hypothetical protein